MADTDNCLNYLLSAKRDSEIISSLRTAKEYLLICAKSKPFKKLFLTYALINDPLDVIVQLRYSS